MTPKELKLRRTMGCLTDCVAYMFNFHPEHVPHFVHPRKGWNRRLRAYFRKHGYFAYWTDCKEVPKKGMHIVCGQSLKWKTAGHAVVYKNGKLVYDPQYPSKWTDKRIAHRLVIDKLLVIGSGI